MSHSLIDFPARYTASPEPTGEKWLEKFEIAKRLVEKGGIVTLLGQRGTGKTRMAYEIANSAEIPNSEVGAGPNAKRTLPRIYRTAMEMFVELRSSYHAKSDWNEFEILRWYRNAALLVIDEIQETGETAFENQKLTAIIDSRYQDARPTIMIANYSFAEMQASLSASVISRITECGGAIVVDWESYRRATR